MDELGYLTTKRKCHISPRCFVYSGPNIRLLGNIWKIQCSFHCTDNCWQSYRLSLCVYVSIPFKPFCGQIIKACLVGGVTSHWPQKLIFPATKYTAPADEVVITEQACSAEVTLSGEKGAGGRGPVERAEPLFPSVSVCLLIFILLEPKDENRSPFVFPPDLCLSGCWGILGHNMMEKKEQMKSRSDSNLPIYMRSDFYLSSSNHYDLHSTTEQRASCREQMRSCILKWLVLFLGCYSNLNIISLVLLPTFLVMNRHWKFSLQRRE